MQCTRQFKRLLVPGVVEPDLAPDKNPLASGIDFNFNFTMATAIHI